MLYITGFSDAVQYMVIYIIKLLDNVLDDVHKDIVMVDKN